MSQPEFSANGAILRSAEEDRCHVTISFDAVSQDHARPESAVEGNPMVVCLQHVHDDKDVRPVSDAMNRTVVMHSFNQVNVLTPVPVRPPACSPLMRIPSTILDQVPWTATSAHASSPG